MQLYNVDTSSVLHKFLSNIAIHDIRTARPRKDLGKKMNGPNECGVAKTVIVD